MRTTRASRSSLRPFLAADGCSLEGGPDLASVIALVKERVSTIRELAKAMVYFYRRVEPSPELRAQYYAPESQQAVVALRGLLETVQWDRPSIGQAIKQAASRHDLKLPQVAMPVRVMVSGGTQTPSIDAVIELIGQQSRQHVLQRLEQELEKYPRLRQRNRRREAGDSEEGSLGRRSVALQNLRLLLGVLLLRDRTRVERLFEIDQLLTGRGGSRHALHVGASAAAPGNRCRDHESRGQGGDSGNGLPHLVTPYVVG